MAAPLWKQRHKQQTVFILRHSNTKTKPCLVNIRPLLCYVPLALVAKYFLEVTTTELLNEEKLPLLLTLKSLTDSQLTPPTALLLNVAGYFQYH